MQVPAVPSSELSQADLTIRNEPEVNSGFARQLCQPFWMALVVSPICLYLPIDFGLPLYSTFDFLRVRNDISQFFQRLAHCSLGSFREHSQI